MSLIATYTALPCRTHKWNLFFFPFSINKSWTAAGLPPGSPSLACIRFLLPAGGAKEEIRRARADVAADLWGVVLLRWGILLRSAEWEAGGCRRIHDDAEALLRIQIRPPALTFQEQNSSNKAALTPPPLLKCQIQLVKMLHGTFGNEILASFPSGKATKSTMWHLINYSILAGRPLGRALC